MLRKKTLQQCIPFHLCFPKLRLDLFNQPRSFSGGLKEFGSKDTRANDKKQ